MRTLGFGLFFSKANTDSKPDPQSQRKRNKNGDGKLDVPIKLNLLTGTTALGEEPTESTRIGAR